MTGPPSASSTIYPDSPVATLVLSWDDGMGTLGTITTSDEDEDEGGPGLWELVWEDDPSSVTWVAVPSNGLAYPGESVTVRNKKEGGGEGGGPTNPGEGVA